MLREYNQVSNQNRQQIWDNYESYGDFISTAAILGVKPDTAREIITPGHVIKKTRWKKIRQRKRRNESYCHEHH